MNLEPEYDDVAMMQPDELGQLKEVVKEFITRLTNIDNEIILLREDRKELIEEFKGKLDIKMLQQALKVVKLEAGVERKDTYHTLKEILQDDFVNDLTE